MANCFQKHGKCSTFILFEVEFYKNNILKVKTKKN